MSPGRIERVSAEVYVFPTPAPESDGTLTWDATTAVVVRVGAADLEGLGWTYSAPAAASVARTLLADAVIGRDADDINGAFETMRRAARNVGTKGLVMQAISAVDIALWDLKGKLLDRSVIQLIGQATSPVPIYGSGGFTSLDYHGLAEQVDEWRRLGCGAMKIKIGEAWGSRVERDLERVRQLRELAGADVALMVDANGGFGPAQARRVGHALDDLGVVWFEEPVSSDDTAGLSELRSTVRCDVAAGEYVADIFDAARLTDAVDCLQLDATRCGGFTGWLQCASVAASHNRHVSAHCAPALHAHVAGAAPLLRHVEYFADHARLEPLLVDGAPPVSDGALHPDPSVLGHGMHVRPDAERFAAASP